jgi:hypothetical protein
MYGSRLSVEERDIVKKLFPNKYDVMFNMGKLNESVDDKVKLSSFEEVEDFIKGKELPYVSDVSSSSMKRSLSSYSMGIIFGFVSKSGDKENTLSIGVDLKDVGRQPPEEREVKVVAVDSNDKVDIKDFLGEHVSNPKSQFNSIYDIVALCDYDRFFTSYYLDSLDYVGRRNPDVKHNFKLIDVSKVMVINGRPVTLFVGYDKVRRKFFMGYNPAFILASALEEFAVNGDKFDNFKHCYIFNLAFLISHEMCHITNHNTDSNIGSLDTNSINPYMDNIFSDSYINVSLSKIYDGLAGAAKAIISSGIGSGFSIRSSASEGGFKKFNSLSDILKKIANTVYGVIGASHKSTVLGSLSGFTDDVVKSLEGSNVFVSINVNEDSKVLRETCATLMTVVNSVIKSVIDGNVYRAGESLSEEEEQNMPPMEDADGLLLGNKVKDKATGRRGVVVQDSKGRLRIAFSDDDDILDKLVEEVNKNAEKYKNTDIPDSLLDIIDNEKD